MKQFRYAYAFVATVIEMLRDPAAFFDPTKEAPIEQQTSSGLSNSFDSLSGCE